MQHPFQSLAPEYDGLLARAVLTRQAETAEVARKLLKTVHNFDDVEKITGVPKVWGAASFERESSSNFRCSPAQGDPWNQVSRHVPRGRGPFPSWQAACIDAYHIDGLQTVGAANWTWARGCFEGELFNGFGYRAHGVHTPYLWAGTSVYSRGKYVADGKWDSGEKDEQLGIIPMMRMMIQLEPGLALPSPLPAAEPTTIVPAPSPLPLGVGGGAHDAAWIQHALNVVDRAGLREDDNYGRRTKLAVRSFQIERGIDVDGIAGPQTFAALEAALAGAAARISA